MGEILLTNRELTDLNPVSFGREECKPLHSFGPAVRKYTLIHYVEQGKGTLFKNNNESYPIRAGEAFIIFPDEVTFYQADKDDPWTYRWIGFDGTLSEKYRQLPPILPIANELFPNVQENSDSMIEYSLAGQLFLMTATLFSGIKHKNHYVRQVKNYINAHYMQEVSVEQISLHLGLDRRYLVRLFKEKTGQTIQDYIIEVRMDEACRQLALGRSVNETATICGYRDTCNFSKMFKRRYGVSPMHWRKLNV